MAADALLRHGSVLPGLGLLVVLAACSPLAGGPADVPVATATTAPAASFPVSDQHDRIVAQYGGVYRDAELARTLARIVGRLVAASDDPSRSYAITILNSSSVNAFALPEGYLYVTRGLLTLAADASEVAAVLAHEMAHVIARHAAIREAQAALHRKLSRIKSIHLASALLFCGCVQPSPCWLGWRAHHAKREWSVVRGIE